MLTIETQIENREIELIDFIKEKISKKIQTYCQLVLSQALYKIQIKVEEKKLKEFEDELNKKLSEIAPLHFSSLHYSPLCTVYNDCGRFLEMYSQRELSSLKGAWKCITYIEFEENFFSREFVKKTVSKMTAQGKMYISRGMGISYRFNDEITKEILNNVQRTGVYIAEGPGELYPEICNNWIFENFTEEEKDKIYEEAKTSCKMIEAQKGNV